MTVQTYAVTGLTCQHCVTAVRAELAGLPGVSAVDVELQAGGVSAVSIDADAPVSDQQVAAALDEAGDYRLA